MSVLHMMTLVTWEIFVSACKMIHGYANKFQH
ncbi:hypothetical protein Xvie_01682 [Xenorhabdus vietnamensis]|uniref:Uncharacterized protein n=1 Tax=Xenorhabdus vietnamensis TaxID=351656 RepID=A0A1Y2SD51_9GAMM|nr:hypothetical protein Xvie_03136 [Xenorhabdus vietnamensis]OTA16599.1 hypothetical protein Xvie_01682 [Xenorhabdus vietnamensis]